MKRLWFAMAGMLVAVSAHAAEDIIILDVMPRMNNPLYEFFVIGVRKFLGAL